VLLVVQVVARVVEFILVAQAQLMKVLLAVTPTTQTHQLPLVVVAVVLVL
jgi:hypothetical protein